MAVLRREGTNVPTAEMRDLRDEIVRAAEITFQSCGLTPEATGVLGAAISDSPGSLRVLRLSHNLGVGDAGVIALLPALAATLTQRLDVLDLSHCSITDAAAGALASLPTPSRPLSLVNLAGNRLGATGLRALLASPLCGGARVNLSGVALAGAGLRACAAALAECAKTGTGPVGLELERVSIDADSGSSAGSLLAQAAGAVALETLSLASNPRLARGCAPLCKALLASAPFLVSLDLSRCGLGARDAGAFAAGFAEVAPPSLTALAVAQNALGDDGAVALFRGLAASRCAERLRAIDVADCGIAEGGAAHVAIAIGALPALQHLILDDNPLGPAGASVISDALPPGLVTLRIAGCQLGDAGAAAIAAAGLPPALVALSVARNALSVAGCAAVCGAALPLRGRLAVLDVADNPGADAAAGHRAAVLSPPPAPAGGAGGVLDPTGGGGGAAELVSVEHPLYPSSFGIGALSNERSIAADVASSRVPLPLRHSVGHRRAAAPPFDSPELMFSSPLRPAGLSLTPFAPSVVAAAAAAVGARVTPEALAAWFAELGGSEGAGVSRAAVREAFLSVPSYGVKLSAREVDRHMSRYSRGGEEESVAFDEFCAIMLPIASR